VAAPPLKAGTKCTIGYQDIIESVPAQKAEQDAAQAEATRLGCGFIALNDQVTPTTQVNNFNQLVAQKVSAIIVFPVVASSLTPSLAKAKAAGIYVLGQSAPVAADDAPIAGYSTNMLHMSDTEAYLRVKSIAAAKPGASFVEMGLAAPVQVLQYYAARTKYWAAKFGLHYLGEIVASRVVHTCTGPFRGLSTSPRGSGGRMSGLTCRRGATCRALRSWPAVPRGARQRLPPTRLRSGAGLPMVWRT
jgi:hypothetical protein